MCVCAVAYQPRNQRLVGEKEVVGGGTAVGGGSSRYCVYMHIGREASYLLQGVSSPLVLELSPFSNIPSPKLSNEKPGLRIPWPDRPTNRPTSPPSRPLSLASVHRTVIFGQNRTVSYLNVSLGAPSLPLPSFLPPAVGSHMHAVFQRRQAFSSYSSTPLDGEMEAVSALPWISSLSLSLLFPFFWEGRGKDRFFFRICFAERGREREEEGLVIRTGTLLRDIFVGCISN